eukprot:scaffold1728_cov53-Phaeocystis_antarctica.AAC.5
MWKTRWLRPRPTGAPGASFSARLCSRLPRASASLGQSAACAALAEASRQYRPSLALRRATAGAVASAIAAASLLRRATAGNLGLALHMGSDSKRHPANTTSRKPPRLECTPG